MFEGCPDIFETPMVKQKVSYELQGINWQQKLAKKFYLGQNVVK